MARTRLVDGLCANLSVLASSCTSLDSSSDSSTIQAYRSAYKAYVVLLVHILQLAEAEAKEAVPAAAAPAKARTRISRDLRLAARLNAYAMPPLNLISENVRVDTP